MSTYPMNPSKWCDTPPSVADRLRVGGENESPDDSLGGGL